MSHSALAIRRITLDIRKVIEAKEPGLMWVQNDIFLTSGWAIVSCVDDTSPYYGASFCFEVTFPYNYPFEPPLFNYLTNDGMTRFNPNLYKNGKVCLSLLNTWQGEQWSGVQSLMSVLQSIQTAVLIPEPLRNEPAYSSVATHIDIPVYTRMVFHATLETAILKQLEAPPPYMLPVYENVRSIARNAKEALIAKARAHASWDGKTEQFGFFTMGIKYRFGALADQLALI